MNKGYKSYKKLIRKGILPYSRGTQSYQNNFELYKVGK